MVAVCQITHFFGCNHLHLLKVSAKLPAHFSHSACGGILISRMYSCFFFLNQLLKVFARPLRVAGAATLLRIGWVI